MARYAPVYRERSPVAVALAPVWRCRASPVALLSNEAGCCLMRRCAKSTVIHSNAPVWRYTLPVGEACRSCIKIRTARSSAESRLQFWKRVCVASSLNLLRMAHRYSMAPLRPLQLRPVDRERRPLESFPRTNSSLASIRDIAHSIQGVTIPSAGTSFAAYSCNDRPTGLLLSLFVIRADSTACGGLQRSTMRLSRWIQPVPLPIRLAGQSMPHAVPFDDLECTPSG